jgi:hypothetical protein
MELALAESFIHSHVAIKGLFHSETREALSEHIAKLAPQHILPGLQIVFTPSSFSSATPVKRRGKSMSRRTGQTGHIEKSGKWWVVRWWMDVAGQEDRVLKRAKICPVAGPGALSASERKRHSREIIAEIGADTVEHFNEVVHR